MKKKQRILVLSSTFPRFLNDTEPRFILDLYLHLKEHYKIDILCPSGKGLKKTELFQGLDVVRFRYAPRFLESLAYDGGILPTLKKNPWKFFLIPLFLMGQVLAINKQLKLHNYCLVHAHWIIPQGFCIWVLSLIIKVPPFMITSHGGDLFSLKQNILQKLKISIIRKSSLLLVVSKAMQFKAEKIGVEKSKIAIAPMGVDLCKTFTPFSQKPEKTKLIFVGRLVEKKGVQVLLQAIKLVLEKKIHIQLDIVGDGPNREELETKAIQLDITKNVRFLGSLSHKMVAEKLKKNSIAIIPSIVTKSGDQEGLGLTIIEAIASGCTVICSDLDAIKDVITDKVSGYTFKAGDHIALSKQIILAINSPKENAEMAILAKQTIFKKYDWNVVAKNHINIYQNVLDKKTYDI